MENALLEIAKATGNTPEDYAAQIVVSHLEPAIVMLQHSGRLHRQIMPLADADKTEKTTATRQTIGSLQGKYAHLNISSAEIRASL